MAEMNQGPLSNFQEQDWQRLFKTDIYSLVEDSSYEDNNLRIKYNVENAAEFVQIRRVTEMTQESLEHPLMVTVTVENKNPEADLRQTTFEHQELARMPLFTSSGFYLGGTFYGARSENTLAPGWYITRLARTVPTYALEHRSRYGINLRILWRRGRFSVSLQRNSNRNVPVDLWCFIKAISEVERFPDILNRLNLLPIFLADYIATQKEYENKNPSGALYSEPSVEECAECVMLSQHRYSNINTDCVSYLNNYIFRDNNMKFEPGRMVRFRKMCGFNVAVGRQLSRDVKFSNEEYLRKGTMLTPEDVARLSQEGIDAIYVSHEGYEYKLFEVTITENPTLNEIVCAIYYFGLAISGIGKMSNPDDFSNKTTKTVSTLFGTYLANQLQKLTDTIVGNHNSITAASINKAFSNLDLRNLKKVSLTGEIFEDSAYNMQDNTNSIAAYEQGFRVTSGARTLGKNPRNVQASHFNRLCSFTTPESKPVGLNLSLSFGSKVVNGYITYPVYKVIDGIRQSGEENIVYLNDTQETNMIIAPATIDLDELGEEGLEEIIPNCRLNGELVSVARKTISYQDKSTLQGLSPILLFVPAANCNSGKRLTMSANAIAQARPTVSRGRPWLSTGVESVMSINVQTARDILQSALADSDLSMDIVKPDTTLTLIEISEGFKDSNNANASYGTELAFMTNIATFERFTYVISRLQPATNSSVIHQRVRVVPGNVYHLDDVVITSNDTDQKVYNLSKDTLVFGKDIVDSDRLKDSAVAPGENVKVLFKSYGGYGYEDAVIANASFAEKYGLATVSIFRVKDNAVVEADHDGTLKRDEAFTPATQNYNDNSQSVHSHLGSEGLPHVGTRMKAGEVVIGKQVKFATKGVRNRSVTLKVGQQGTVINTYLLRNNTNIKQVTIANVIIGNLDSLTQGDKVGGLHGNKGVIGKIVPDCDMDYTKFGTPDVVLNPLGVISRTNNGQLVEELLGMIGMRSNVVQFLEPFNDMPIDEMIKKAADLGIEEVEVFSGRTGLRYERKAFLGNMYFLRSSHTSTSVYNACGLTDVKRNSTSMQPIKCSGGGQRVGELLANAIRAHNAPEVLNSLFTTQSDDLESHRELVYNIENGRPLTPVRGTSKNSELFLAHFRTLGLNIHKDTEKGINKLVPLKQKDIEDLSIWHISRDVISTANNFLRNKAELDDRAKKVGIQDSERHAYSSIELPRKVIMPLMCYGNRFLNMFIIYYNGAYKMMSTIMFKNILFNNYILLDRNFESFPAICQLRKAREDGIYNEQVALTGAAALMCIFERYNRELTVAFIEQSVGDVEGMIPYETNVRYQLQGLALDVSVATEDNEDIDTIGADPIAVASKAANLDGDTEIFKLDDAIEEITPSSEEVENAENALTEQQAKELLEKQEESENGDIGSDGTAPEEEPEQEVETSKETLKDKKLTGSKGMTELMAIRGVCIQFLKTQDMNDYFVHSILVPPLAYRPDYDGRIASPIDKQLLSLIGKLKGYNSNPSDWTFNTVYRELFWMVVRNPRMKVNDKNIFEMIVSHENKNSKVRDTLYAKRVMGSGRSVIIVNPELRLGECKIPFTIAVEYFTLHLLSDSGKKFPILNSYRLSNKVTDDSKRHYTQVFTALGNDNMSEFAKLLNLREKGYKELQQIFNICRNELRQILEQYLSIYPVVLNREPSLHKFNALVFKGLLTDGYAIELHPLACRPFNADFDGDQMAAYIIFCKEALEEAKVKMSQQNNLVNPNNGKLIIELNQDMILGLYWLTMNASNQFRVEDPQIVKTYEISAAQVARSYLTKITTDLETGVLQNTDVVTFDYKGKKGIGLAQDVLYSEPSEREHSVFEGCFELVSGRRVPPDASIVQHYADDAGDNMTTALNSFDFYQNLCFRELWADINDGRVRPQDVIVVTVGNRNYKSTAGRIIFNSLLPDGLGFTDKVDTHMRIIADTEMTQTSFYELLFDFTINSKTIEQVLNFLRRYFGDGVQKQITQDIQASEQTLITESNNQFCYVLDRLKDIGFAMADKSCVSLSLYDFKQLELARNNVTTVETLKKQLNNLVTLPKTECISGVGGLLAPLNELIYQLTLNQLKLVRTRTMFVKNLSHIMVALNDQLRTPYDYVYMQSPLFTGIQTISQAYIREILQSSEITYPLTVEALEKVLEVSCTNSGIVIRRAKEFLGALGTMASKTNINIQSYMPEILKEATKDTGVSLMQHKLGVISKKFKEGRLTDKRKTELIQSIVGEYRNIVGSDIEQALELSRNSNLYIMVKSGARGNMNQLMEVCGIIGTVTDGAGNPIPTPIEGNLLNGLSPAELFTSSYHARSILVNTQMDIPVSGALNRDLSHLTEYITIRPEELPDETFCKTDPVRFPLNWEPYTQNENRVRICLTDQYLDIPDIDIMRWEDFLTKYFAIHSTFVLHDNNVEWLRNNCEDPDSRIFMVSQGGQLTPFTLDKLQRGMELFIGEFGDSLISQFRQSFVTSCGWTEKVKQLLSEAFITRICIYNDRDEVKSRSVYYKLDKLSRDGVYYRSVELSDLSQDVRALAEELCYAKRDSKMRQTVIAHIVSHAFLDQLEAKQLFITDLPIYTIINCKCTNGICRRCFGMKYDTDMMPVPGELIGFQGVQAVCATISQMILDTHKSSEGGAAQREIKSISRLISEAVTLEGQISVNLETFIQAVLKDITNVLDPEVSLAAVNRHLQGHALKLLIKDTAATAEFFRNQLQGTKKDTDGVEILNTVLQEARLVASKVQSYPTSKMQVLGIIEIVVMQNAINRILEELLTTLSEEASTNAENADYLIFVQKLKSVPPMFYNKIVFDQITSEGPVQLLENIVAELQEILVANSKYFQQLDIANFGEMLKGKVLKVSDRITKECAPLYQAFADLMEPNGRTSYNKIFLDAKNILASHLSTMPVETTSVSDTLRQGLRHAIFANNSESEMALYLRLSVWLELIQLLRNKGVLARNLELFPKALIECGVAMQDTVGADGTMIFTGCVYNTAVLEQANVKYEAIKLSMAGAMGANGQVYADCFLSNVRQNVIKHVVAGTNDRGSPIGQMITSKHENIIVKNVHGSPNIPENLDIPDVQNPEDMYMEFDPNDQMEEADYWTAEFKTVEPPLVDTEVPFEFVAVEECAPTKVEPDLTQVFSGQVPTESSTSVLPVPAPLKEVSNNEPLTADRTNPELTSEFEIDMEAELAEYRKRKLSEEEKKQKDVTDVIDESAKESKNGTTSFISEVETTSAFD